MFCSVLIATYGEDSWKDLAWSRAYPSAVNQVEDIHVFHDPEGTIASTRNETAKWAKGEWLCFLDADDELAPGYMDAMERAAEQAGDGAYLLTPAVRKIHLKGGRGVPWNDFYGEVDLLTGNWLIIGTLIQKSLFMELGGFEDRPHGIEDWHLWARAYKAGAQPVRVPEAVYIQHYNPKSKHWRLMKNKDEHERHAQLVREDLAR